MRRPARKKVLFIRDFRGFTGGHQKVFDYYSHLVGSPEFEPILYLTPDSLRDQTNPWIAGGHQVLDSIPAPDIFFVAGLDWDILDKHGVEPGRRPVINLVQGLRHTDPRDPRFRFLEREAFRICVSQEVREALKATCRTKGSLLTIPNGIELPQHLSIPPANLRTGVFIGGWKQPALARELAQKLRQDSIPVDVCMDQVPRNDFLTRTAACQVAVMLPWTMEGFFLPALEAMALDTALVVPDCVGNRSFCLHAINCLMPEYQIMDLVAATKDLLNNTVLRSKLVKAGRTCATEHSLGQECCRWLEVLRSLESN